MQNSHVEIVREHERRKITGLSRVTWWRLERDGRAPKRLQLGPNSVGWLRDEIGNWISQRAAERDGSAPAR